MGHRLAKYSEIHCASPPKLPKSFFPNDLRCEGGIQHPCIPLVTPGLTESTHPCPQLPRPHHERVVINCPGWCTKMDM